MLKALKAWLSKVCLFSTLRKAATAAAKIILALMTVAHFFSSMGWFFSGLDF